MSLILALRQWRQINLSVVETSLSYIVNSRPIRDKEWDPISTTTTINKIMMIYTNHHQVPKYQNGALCIAKGFVTILCYNIFSSSYAKCYHVLWTCLSPTTQNWWYNNAKVEIGLMYIPSLFSLCRASEDMKCWEISFHSY